MGVPRSGVNSFCSGGFSLFFWSRFCFGENIFHCTVVEAFICSYTFLIRGFSGEKEVDTVRISRKLYFPADEVSRKRNFPTIPQTSTLLFRRSAFYSCLQYITAPLSVHISRSFRINSAFSVIYTSQPPFLVPSLHLPSVVC